MGLELHTPLAGDAPTAGAPFALSLPLGVLSPVVFAPDVQLVLEEAGSEAVAWIGRLGEEVRIPWLPRGTWFLRWMTPALALAAGRYRARAIAVGAHGERSESALEFEVGGGLDGGPLSGAWQLESGGDGPDLASLAWRRPDSPFSRRFDAAATLIAERLLEGTAALGARVLEIGCGDGALALGLALRRRPAAIVAVDRDAAWHDLRSHLVAHGLPADALPEALRFVVAEEPRLPFDDADFDLVLCWNDLDAFGAGGRRALAEAVRVLAPDGLLCLRTHAAVMPIGGLEASLRALGLRPWRILGHCLDRVDIDAHDSGRAIPDLAMDEVIGVWRRS